MWQQKADKKLSTGCLVLNLPIFSKLEQGKEFSVFPYSIIITQACHIASYYKALIDQKKNPSEPYNRQLITQVLLLPAFEEESFKSGTHLEKQYGKKIKSIETAVFSRIKIGQDFRHHFLADHSHVLPNLFIDFKHYFTVPIEIVIETVEQRESFPFELEFKHYTDLSDRFAHYLQRVAV